MICKRRGKSCEASGAPSSNALNKDSTRAIGNISNEGISLIENLESAISKWINNIK